MMLGHALALYELELCQTRRHSFEIQEFFYIIVLEIMQLDYCMKNRYSHMRMNWCDICVTSGNAPTDLEISHPDRETHREPEMIRRERSMPPDAFGSHKLKRLHLTDRFSFVRDHHLQSRPEQA